MGDSLLWAVFKNTDVAKHFGLFCFKVQIMCYIILTKTGLGYILGDFFSNSLVTLATLVDGWV
jgi:hypothetical protein